MAREKAIADTLNLFNYDLGRKALVAVGWCPVSATADIQLALRRGTERSGALTHTILSVVKQPADEPPTYFKTNKVQYAFQVIVEAYGVARYREVNPTPLTVVTFPFLFAIMFGDLGHGTLMTIFAALLIIFEKKISKFSLGEMGDMIYTARYMLLGMGAFSMYTGLLYNEMFAVGLDFFGGSRWHDSNFGPNSEVACANGGCGGDSAAALLLCSAANRLAAACTTASRTPTPSCSGARRAASIRSVWIRRGRACPTRLRSTTRSR